LSPDGRWQQIKASIVDAIFSKKHANTIRILASTCADVDIICLQESAASFKDALEKDFGSKYHIIAPEDADPKRDQNSMVLLSKCRFPRWEEVTASVRREITSDSLVERGDLVAVTTQDSSGAHFLVASFHGDTNGLATKPVVTAVCNVWNAQTEKCSLIFGLDANTYLEEKAGRQGVEDFLAHCKTLGLRSWIPEDLELSKCFTCCNARTYVQPQLNKAIRCADKLTKGDQNPKDHILVDRCSFDVVSSFKDNTGDRMYVEGQCFPTLQFPSDHGVVSVFLQRHDAKS